MDSHQSELFYWYYVRTNTRNPSKNFRPSTTVFLFYVQYFVVVVFSNFMFVIVVVWTSTFMSVDSYLYTLLFDDRRLPTCRKTIPIPILWPLCQYRDGSSNTRSSSVSYLFLSPHRTLNSKIFNGIHGTFVSSFHSLQRNTSLSIPSPF